MEHWRARTRGVIVGFGLRVRERRLAAGISQDQLGRRANMREKFIGQIERGTSNPSLESMALVAGALDCTVADLLTPTCAAPYLTLRIEDVQRAQEALAILGSVLVPRKKTPYR